MEKHQKKLDPFYVTGLTDGEGCFSVSFSCRQKLKLKIETKPSFSLSLNKRDLDLVQKIREYFCCGTVRYSRSDRMYKYESRSVSDLVTKVIPHFEKYPLQSEKKKDFNLFVGICRSIRSNQHRNKSQLYHLI